MRDLLLMCHVWTLATLAAPMAKWMPLKRVLRLLTPPRRCRPYKGATAEAIRLLVDRRLARPLVMAYRPCLRRGLVLFHMLQLADLPARLHFGLYPKRQVADAFRGHCWVTVNGDCIGEPPEPSLTVIWTHEGPAG